ncbi:MAG: LexA family protein, partial [Candidatus Puniceispirillales bacterium]
MTTHSSSPKSSNHVNAKDAKPSSAQGRTRGRGGARPGAGRPAGQGQYGEPTKPIRLPVSMIDEVMDYVATGGRQSLPLFSCAVAAGFPSPADDHLEGSLNLNDYLVKHPAATFFVRVSGDSMIKAGIHENDILVVDRSLE